jgi:hypothetical protein
VLNVNISVTNIDLFDSEVDESVCVIVDKLFARNKRIRRLLLFDARKMLLSRLCSDEIGVVWLYFLNNSNGADDGTAPADIESIRAELAVVVDEHYRRKLCQPALVSDVRSLQLQIAALKDIGSEQTNQIVEQTHKIDALNDTVSGQSNQINELQRLTHLLLDQNREIHSLLVSRARELPADSDAGDSRAVKRRRTSR